MNNFEETARVTNGLILKLQELQPSNAGVGVAAVMILLSQLIEASAFVVNMEVGDWIDLRRNLKHLLGTFAVAVDRYEGEKRDGQVQ